MKGVNANGIRSKQVFLTLVTLICTTLIIWAWERTPLIATLLPQGGLLKVSPGNVSSGYPQAFEEDHLSNAEAGLEIPSDSDETGAVSPMSSVIAVNQSHVKQKKCNFGKGRWIPDAKRPLYSGYECKQWLSEMWACRIMERTDFSFEGFRWQSENCDMPDFTGTAFLERMKNRVLAFVGDSLGRQQFQSLMCMITGGKISLEVKDVGKDYGLVKAPGAIRPDGWAYWFPSTNTTVLYYWSASLCELNPLNPSDRKSNVSMNLDRPPHFLQKYLHRFDVLVLNTGHHWNRGKLDANRWVMYAGGEPVTDKNLLLIPNAKNFTVYSIVKWVDSQLPKHPHLKAFFRTISPRHFAGGDWNTGGSCDNMVPFARGAEVTQDGSSDSSVDGAVRGTRVKILDITALSQLRDEGHISKFSVKAAPGMQDCLHWCLPGIPDAWNEILFAQI